MKKIPKLVKILLIFLALGFILLLMRGPEDTWLCQNGQWVKHGNPSASAPIVPCK
jgi:hypothetical protein